MAEGSKRTLGWLAVAVGAAAVAGFIFRAPLAEWWWSRSFPEEKLREITGVEHPPGDASVAPGEVPYRTGKVLIARAAVWKGPTVTSGERELEPPRLDEDSFRLDSSLRAASPEEVDTLVLVMRHAIEVGQYVAAGGGGMGPLAGDRAKQEVAKLKVYDLRQRILIGEHEIWGPPPKFQVDATESRIGAPADVAGFVATMPVR